MFKAVSKRYDSGPSMTESKKLDPVSSRATGRRALGDITNSYATGEGSGRSVKKPMLTAPSTQLIDSETPRNGTTVMEDVESMDVDDRFYMNREADNIDARDGGNPLLCTTYVNEMYQSFLVQERDLKVNANYMASQPHVNEYMRSILIDWLVCAYQIYVFNIILLIFYCFFFPNIKGGGPFEVQDGSRDALPNC